MDLVNWLKNQWDRAVAVGLAVAGFVTLGLGWWGLSGVGLPSEQIPYVVSGAVLGLFLLGAGSTLWLSADMRDEWRKLDEIHEALLDQSAAVPAEDAVVDQNGLAQQRRPALRVRR